MNASRDAGLRRAVQLSQCGYWVTVIQPSTCGGGVYHSILTRDL
ncbi:hypothetical protein [Candidatus Palauibacter sp.]